MPHGVRHPRRQVAAFGDAPFASAYWFAMQTIVGVTVIVAIRHQWTGDNYSVVRTGMVLAGLQVFFALIGYNWLKLISRFGLPVKVAGILYLFWVLVHTPGASYRPPAALPFHSIRAGATSSPRCG